MYGMLVAIDEFRKVEISHVCKQDNRPTHLLAKHAVSIVNFSTWIEESLFFRISYSLGCYCRFSLLPL